MARARTAAQKSALRKAQLASARKRKGKHINGGVRVGAAIAGGLIASNVASAVTMRAGPGISVPIGIGTGIGTGIAISGSIKKHNAKVAKRNTKRTVRHGHSAQKGRKIA